jgi:hypothetical protein
VLSGTNGHTQPNAAHRRIASIFFISRFTMRSSAGVVHRSMPSLSVSDIYDSVTYNLRSVHHASSEYLDAYRKQVALLVHNIDARNSRPSIEKRHTNATRLTSSHKQVAADST